MSKLKVLLVLRNRSAFQAVRILVEKQVEWVLAGEVTSLPLAIDWARTTQPDVVVLEFDPRAERFERIVPLVKKLLSVVPDTKLLLLTSHCSEPDIRMALGAGVTGLLSKSEVDTRFVSAVKHTASGKRFLSGNLARLVLRRFLHSAVERSSDASPLKDLTPREREIVRLVSLGKGNKQVAAELGIAVRTAEVHRANAMRKLNLHSLAELIHFAVSTGLIQVPAAELGVE